MKIDHVGIAVASLAEARPVFEKLLGCAATEEAVEEQKVRVLSFDLSGSRIELLEASSPDSPIAKFLANRGPGLHHMTLTVPDLDETLLRLEAEGFQLIDRQPRLGAGNERIAFLHPSSTAGVLIELMERKSEHTE